MTTVTRGSSSAPAENGRRWVRCQSTSTGSISTTVTRRTRVVAKRLDQREADAEAADQDSSTGPEVRVKRRADQQPFRARRCACPSGTCRC